MQKNIFNNYFYDKGKGAIYSKKTKKYIKPYYSTLHHFYRVKLYFGNGNFLQMGFRRAVRLLGQEEELPKKINYKNILEEIFGD